MNQKKALLTAFFVVFLDLLGFGIIIPILPYYAKAYGASGWEIGWLMTAYSLMQFIFAPLWGRVSDRRGRRPVLLLSILGQGLAMAGLGFAPSLFWLFVGRFFAGICAANISTAYAYVTDVTDEKNRAKGMGVIGAAFGLGFIFGPAVGGALSVWGYSAPMFAGAVLSGLNFLFALRYLPEPALSEEQRRKNRSRKLDRSTLRTVFSSPLTAKPVFTFFIFTFAMVQMEVVFAIFMDKRYHFDARQAGVLLAGMGVIGVIIQGGLIGKLSRRFGEKPLVTFGAMVGALGLFLAGASHELWFTVLGLGGFGIAHAIIHPSLSSLTSKGTTESNRGLVMGVFQSAGSLSRVLSPPIAGLLFDQVGSGFPFYLASVLLVLILVVQTWGLKTPSGTRAHPST